MSLTQRREAKVKELMGQSEIGGDIGWVVSYWAFTICYEITMSKIENRSDPQSESDPVTGEGCGAVQGK